MAESPVLRPRSRTTRRSTTPLTISSSTNGISFAQDTPKRHGNGVNLLLGGEGRLKVTPCTPIVDASFRNGDKVSPTLAKLRNTPGNLLKEKQTILVRKHEETRKKVDSLNVGGGVSIWPQMDSMRMTREETYRLATACLLLCVSIIAVFYCLHGETLSQLLEFQRRLQRFSKHNNIVVTSGQQELDQSLISWHHEYRQIVDSIHSTFDVSNVPLSYMAWAVLYASTIAVLFYYLIDNMFAKSKLSPRRIKRWVSLLVLTTTWTLLITVTFIIALRTEAAIESNIYNLSNTLADVIPTNLTCDKFHQVLEYWRTRCLPPTTHGTISIFGILPVRDVTFYLQYYSIPIATVLFTPVFRLIVSLMTVYNMSSVTDTPANEGNRCNS